MIRAICQAQMAFRLLSTPSPVCLSKALVELLALNVIAKP